MNNFKKEAEEWANKILAGNKTDELFRDNLLIYGRPSSYCYHSTEDGIKSITKKEFEELRTVAFTNWVEDNYFPNGVVGLWSKTLRGGETLTTEELLEIFNSRS